MSQDKRQEGKSRRSISVWSVLLIVAAVVLGQLACAWLGLAGVTLLLAPLWAPPSRPELEPLVPVYPGATKVESLSRSSVYVGNCCTAFQVAYFTSKPMSDVRLFYEQEFGKPFLTGEGFPVHPNFKDYGTYPTCMSVSFCRPDCDTPDYTSQSVSLIDANELLEKEGTVIVFQVHEETFWYKYEHLEEPTLATTAP